MAKPPKVGEIWEFKVEPSKKSSLRRADGTHGADECWKKVVIIDGVQVSGYDKVFYISLTGCKHSSDPDWFIRHYTKVR